MVGIVSGVAVTAVSSTVKFASSVAAGVASGLPARRPAIADEPSPSYVPPEPDNDPMQHDRTVPSPADDPEAANRSAPPPPAETPVQAATRVNLRNPYSPI